MELSHIIQLFLSILLLVLQTVESQSPEFGDPIYNLVYAEKFPPTIDGFTDIILLKDKQEKVKDGNQDIIVKYNQESTTEQQQNAQYKSGKNNPERNLDISVADRKPSVHAVHKVHEAQQDNRPYLPYTLQTPYMYDKKSIFNVQQENIKKENSSDNVVSVQPFEVQQDNKFVQRPYQTTSVQLAPQTRQYSTVKPEEFHENGIADFPPFRFIVPDRSARREIVDTAGQLKDAVVDFVDVPLIRAVVDLYFDGTNTRGRISPDSRPAIRSSNEGIRRFLTTLAGGILGKQQCWDRIICKMGELIGGVQGKHIFFLLLDRTIPEDWAVSRSALNLAKEGAQDKTTCNRFSCNDQREEEV